MPYNEAQCLDFNIHTTNQHNFKKSVPFNSSYLYPINHLIITYIAQPRTTTGNKSRYKFLRAINSEIS
jgi:hypothetical protein